MSGNGVDIDHVDVSHTALLRLQRSAQIGMVLVLIFIIVSGGLGGLLLRKHSEFWATQLFALTVALLAYIIVTWLHDVLVRRHLQLSMEQSIEEHIAKALLVVSESQAASISKIVDSATQKLQLIEKESFSILSRQFPNFLPRQVFPPANTSNPLFVRSVREAMLRSSTFYFKGVTARYLAPAIRSLSPNLRCEVLILDPRLEQDIWLYAQNRYAIEGSGFGKREELLRRVREEIYSSIVALSDIASITSIVVKLHAGPVFYRTELFDDRAFVSFYVDHPKSVYPISYEYDQSSFYFRAFQRDITDALSTDRPTIDLSGGVSERQLVGFLKKMGCALPLETLRAKAAEVHNELAIHWQAGDQ